MYETEGGFLGNSTFSSWRVQNSFAEWKVLPIFWAELVEVGRINLKLCPLGGTMFLHLAIAFLFVQAALDDGANMLIQVSFSLNYTADSYRTVIYKLSGISREQALVKRGVYIYTLNQRIFFVRITLRWLLRLLLLLPLA